MAAATFTKIASSPEMIRYFVSSTDGTSGSITAATLISDCQTAKAYPLAALLTQVNAAGSWGAVSAAIASPNPATNPKISVTCTPYTADSGATVAAASYQWYNTGSANALSVLGGVHDTGTAAHNITSAILEIRLNHSISR